MMAAARTIGSVNIDMKIKSKTGIKMDRIIFNGRIAIKIPISTRKNINLIKR
jgi:hypothetical protein